MTSPDEAERFVLDLLGWMLEGLDDDGRERAVQDLRATIAAHSGADGVVFGSSTWTIRATPMSLFAITREAGPGGPTAQARSSSLGWPSTPPS